MPFKQRLIFAFKHLWRDWKAGELVVLSASLIIAITSHTSIGFFTDRIEKAMDVKSRDLLGGDLIIKSPESAPSEWLENAEQSLLQRAETQEFTSVIFNEDELLLVSVKSVSDAYPLKGFLKIANELYGHEEIVGHGPGPGEVWVEAHVISKLKLVIGQSLILGNAEFKVSKIITHEPDRGNFYSFTPRVMINQNDLVKTGILGPGSRVTFHYLFSGSQEAVDGFKSWVQEKLSPRQELIDLQTERPTISQALGRAQQYMGFASLLAVLLAAVAIATSSKHYSERHYDSTALLRCLGCKQKDIIFLHMLQLSIIAMFAGLIGSLLGWLAQFILVLSLGDLLPEAMPGPDISPLISGMAISFLILYAFSLPSLIRLGLMSPLRVLRKELQPVSLSAWFVYGGAMILVVIMMWFYTGNLNMTLSILLGSFAVLVFALILTGCLFWILKLNFNHFSLPARAGLRNLLRRQQQTFSQVMALGLTLMAILIVLFLRTDLLNNWQNTIPDEAPNYFTINILEKNKLLFEEFLHQEDIKSNMLYPMIRGRLTRINGKPVKEAVSKEENDHESLNRELNLTALSQLQEDNQIIAGLWWDENKRKELPGVSIESHLAEELGITVGDKLSFITGYQEWVAEVQSIRKVKWESFRPNFYLVFEPQALEGLPYTYMTSFYLPEEKRKVLNKMLKQFPELSIFELDALLKQVKSIMTQLTMAVEFVLFFVLAAGLCIAIACMKASMDSRMLEGALIRALGGSNQMIRSSQRIEFAALGAIAGIIAVVGTEILNAFSYYVIFHLDYRPNYWAWLLVPLLSSLFLGILGIYSSRKIIVESPLQVLRRV